MQNRKLLFPKGNNLDTHTAMQTYAKVVELGSFAAAADKMGQARSVVTRQIAYLEQKYGVRLLNRTTRKLSMTDAGRAFYERVRPILAEVADLEQARAEGQRPSGRLRISAPCPSASCTWGRPSPNTCSSTRTWSSTWT